VKPPSPSDGDGDGVICCSRPRQIRVARYRSACVKEQPDSWDDTSQNGVRLWGVEEDIFAVKRPCLLFSVTLGAAKNGEATPATPLAKG